MGPNMTVQTVTNQYLAPNWWDLVLRDNYFFAKILQKPEKWNGSQMLFPRQRIWETVKHILHIG